MKKFLISGILIFFTINSFAQEERKIPFSVAISSHIVKYNQKIDAAYQDKDLERAEFLFDSLVVNHLSGTYMDNFNVYPLKGEPISLEEYEKPIFLITYASWCVPGIGEIPALNDLVDKFHDQIDFVVLFWDNKENLKEKIREYTENIQLVHIDEKTNQDSYIINKLKHALGFPMMYFIDENKEILDIRKIVTHHSSETLSNSYNIHFNSLSKGVSLLIANLDTPEENEEDTRTDEERDIDREFEQYERERDSLNSIRDN
ncbi:TlpA family protein disulfide reductase [Aquimarina pacifica]|uniref:TlpA family protein disulfide reductase n=1 Tax=Aquimarina pacifica TaxID=1296415 RepID=UPI00046F9DB9|nr:redoxin domain-containing protein [Aquimarina pacifica]